MSVSLTHRHTTSRTVTTRTPRALEQSTVPQKEPALLASELTWQSIETWGTNTAQSWLHPVGDRQYKELRVGQRIAFKYIGTPSRNCTVEVLHKSADYEKFKAIAMFGPFTAEAAFPWAAYSSTYLVHVKKV
jgi:hypothetical protein